MKDVTLLRSFFCMLTTFYDVFCHLMRNFMTESAFIFMKIIKFLTASIMCFMKSLRTSLVRISLCSLYHTLSMFRSIIRLILCVLDKLIKFPEKILCVQTQRFSVQCSGCFKEKAYSESVRNRKRV